MTRAWRIARRRYRISAPGYRRAAWKRLRDVATAELARAIAAALKE